MSDFSSRLRTVQRQTGYVAHPDLQQMSFRERGTQPSNCHLATIDSMAPLHLIVVGRIDPRDARLSEMGNWNSSSKKPASSAKWSFTLVEPSDPELQTQFKRAVVVLDSIQQRAKDTYDIPFAHSITRQRSIRLSAPMVQRRTDPSNDTGFHISELENDWNVPNSHRDAWDVLMTTHQLKPMIALGEDCEPLSPSDYMRVLPGAVVEVHFLLKLHTWMNPPTFSASIASLLVWKQRSTAVSDYITAYDSVPLTLGPYRQQFAYDCKDISYVSIIGWGDHLYQPQDSESEERDSGFASRELMQTKVTQLDSHASIDTHSDCAPASNPAASYVSKGSLA